MTAVTLLPENNLHRRQFLTVSAGLTASLLTACGADDAGPAPAARRTVATDKGPVEVPMVAQRVVCADFYGAFAVVDLGMIPIAAAGTGYADTGPRYAPKLKGVTLIGDFTEPNPERVAAAGPDLILRTIDTSDALYRQLSEIAPTVVISFQKLTLPDVAVRCGEVLGRKPQADALLALYRQRCAELKTKYADTLARLTFTFAQAASDATFWTLGKAWTDTQVLLDCGGRLAAPSATQDKATQEYSTERIGILKDSDVLLIPAGPDGKTAAPDNAPLTGSPLWPTLPAVRAGRVYPVVSGASSLGNALELVDRLDVVLGELKEA
ncbi:ABC transporter substrate-binding protein [Kribbella sandramycini]|uniref:ABC transporter substrate-binding protein n=1 Tax=Kribbella sandramycini TaxID=60450 RepID=A0A7Y4L7I7_9ACTN|nr:ABC transporter substrate-binding protein [Kribbella sandramycini]MBB6570247.1 iron complex transport system substrate-binding protein [Kribbella sandramycini]NOL45834.1 ABC transporter substrate-binding protein [Kribbella sandramycini]